MCRVIVTWRDDHNRRDQAVLLRLACCRPIDRFLGPRCVSPYLPSRWMNDTLPLLVRDLYIGLGILPEAQELWGSDYKEGDVSCL